MATIDVKHKPGRSTETAATITANTAGSTAPMTVLGPKQPDCPFPKGGARYIKESSGVYRFVEHVNMGAAGTEPTTYTADNNS